MPEDKKVLIRVDHLRQWFPLKEKGKFVKANDGITLNIYEGETFGLVGESGCGKSTLGRTLLQFYKQTDGRSLYYGRDIDEFVPGYVKATLKDLDRRKNKWQKLEKLRAAEAEAYEALGEKEKLKQKSALDKTTKEANDAFLDMASIVGGFLATDDLPEAQHLFLQRYDISFQIKKLREKLYCRQRDLEDIAFDIETLAKNGKPTVRLEREKAACQQKITALETAIDAERVKYDAVNQELEAMRRTHEKDAEFQRIEAKRDNGIDLARLTYSEMRLLRRDLQMIFQDPYSSLNPRMTVGQIISEGMLAHGMFRKNNDWMQQAILDVMAQCGLAPYFLHRFPHQFSGGQRQRIGIARSLAVKPRFIVCDEAVSALDVSIQAQVINLLQELKEKNHLTYLFITHDLSVVKYISDRIGVMYLGAMVEVAGSQEIFDNPRHPYTEALLAAIPTTAVKDHKKPLQILEGDIPSPVNPPSGCKFHSRCKYCTEICEHVVPAWEQVGENHFVACHHKLPVKEASFREV